MAVSHDTAQMRQCGLPRHGLMTQDRQINVAAS